VTADEITRPYDLGAVARVNGQEFGRTSTASLQRKFEEAIEALSADAVLPGDVIAFPLELRPRVTRGDVIELEIEKIGVLRTRVV
jgi:2-keto-4-pentenoate hydratase/2-oxohepta-3-ene-1,7-dioic acid hydratase in catechol pathway